MRKIIQTFPLLVIISLILSSCTTKSYRTASGMIWNTLYNITYEGPEALADSILPMLNGVAASVSAFDSLSIVSKINRNEIELMDSIMLEIYFCSVRVNRESGGAFDPTVAPLVTAWGFGKGHTATGDTARLDELLKYVGITKSRAEGLRLVKSDPRMEFNFSAIAKGYGCDAVGRMFRRNGVDNYLIEIGGEICAYGRSPRGDLWTIAIDKPIFSDSVTHRQQCLITLDNQCVATSGDYRNFHTENGKRYGHTINPQTGRPAATDVLSATVVAATCMEADAFATAAMAMGSTEAMKMAKRLKLAMFLVTGTGETLSTPEFQKLIK